MEFSQEVINRIKENMLHITITMKKKHRNYLNKQLQDAVCNYFLENYVAIFLKDDYQIVSGRELRKTIQKKLPHSGKKYINLLNAFKNEIIRVGKQNDYRVMLSNIVREEEKYTFESEEWCTLQRKKMLALLLIVHWEEENILNFYDMWNFLYPNDPLIKKKMSLQEKQKQQKIARLEEFSQQQLEEARKPNEDDLIHKKIKIITENDNQIRKTDIDNLETKEQYQNGELIGLSKNNCNIPHTECIQGDFQEYYWNSNKLIQCDSQDSKKVNQLNSLQLNVEQPIYQGYDTSSYYNKINAEQPFETSTNQENKLLPQMNYLEQQCDQDYSQKQVSYLEGLKEEYCQDEQNNNLPSMNFYNFEEYSNNYPTPSNEQLPDIENHMILFQKQEGGYFNQLGKYDRNIIGHRNEDHMQISSISLDHHFTFNSQQFPFFNTIPEIVSEENNCFQIHEGQQNVLTSVMQTSANSHSKYLTNNNNNYNSLFFKTN